MRRLQHELSQSHRRFRAEDELFDRSDIPASIEIAAARPRPGGMTVREAVTIYLTQNADRRLSHSQVDEIA